MDQVLGNRIFVQSGLKSDNRSSSYDFLIPAILLAALATWLRFHNLGQDSFWLDEILTINTARHGLVGGLNSLHHPPGSIPFDLDLPETPTDLIFRFALAPESKEWGGDGSTFVVRIAAPGEPQQTVFRQHIGYDPAEQDWHDGRVSLADYAGQSITLTLATETGPAGDGTGDWAGWETPRIVTQPGF